MTQAASEDFPELSMNGKTVKLLRRYAAIHRLPWRAVCDLWRQATPGERAVFRKSEGKPNV